MLLAMSSTALQRSIKPLRTGMMEMELVYRRKGLERGSLQGLFSPVGVGTLRHVRLDGGLLGVISEFVLIVGTT